MLMKKSLALVAALALSAAFTAPVAAQSNYPSQNVKIVVPFAAGSLTDMLARILSDKLSPVWHQSIIVESQPGIAGTAATAKAAPDGYTFLLVSNGHTVIKTITPNL